MTWAVTILTQVFLGLDWAALFLRWKICREKMQMVRIALRENRVDLAVLTAVVEIIEITRHTLEMFKFLHKKTQQRGLRKDSIINHHKILES